MTPLAESFAPRRPEQPEVGGDRQRDQHGIDGKGLDHQISPELLVAVPLK